MPFWAFASWAGITLISGFSFTLSTFFRGIGCFSAGLIRTSHCRHESQRKKTKRAVFCQR